MDHCLISLIIISIKKLNSNVILKGYVSNVLDYYSRAKVLVMPSTSEGLSTAMLEAMSVDVYP